MSNVCCDSPFDKLEPVDRLQVIYLTKAYPYVSDERIRHRLGCFKRQEGLRLDG